MKKRRLTLDKEMLTTFTLHDPDGGNFSAGNVWAAVLCQAITDTMWELAKDVGEYMTLYKCLTNTQTLPCQSYDSNCGTCNESCISCYPAGDEQAAMCG